MERIKVPFDQGYPSEQFQSPCFLNMDQMGIGLTDLYPEAEFHPYTNSDTLSDEDKTEPEIDFDPFEDMPYDSTQFSSSFLTNQCVIDFSLDVPIQIEENHLWLSNVSYYAIID